MLFVKSNYPGHVLFLDNRAISHKVSRFSTELKSMPVNCKDAK